MSQNLPCRPRLLTVIVLSAGRFLSRTTVVFDAKRLWLSVGTTSECDIIVTEPNFPQLAFQINWHSTREPLLYVHPATVWLDGQVQQASLRNSIFPLGHTAAIHLYGTTTVFLVSRANSARTDEQNWHHIAKLTFLANWLLPSQSGKSAT
ncbi:MAG: hypothetical protein ACUVR8_03295 [Acidobacteriota bacterium]